MWLGRRLHFPDNLSNANLLVMAISKLRNEGIPFIWPYDGFIIKTKNLISVAHQSEAQGLKTMYTL